MKKGWRPDLEDNKFLYTNSVDFPTFSENEIPEKVDPRGKIQVKNQGQIGSCSGFSRSYCMEALYNGLGESGKVFSPMFAYLTGQAIDGNLGRDTGASISGGIKASRKYGNCQESLFPYTGRYTTNVPRKCLEDAEKHQLLAHQPVTSVEQCRLSIGSGYPVYLGIIWNSSVDRAKVDMYSDRQNEGGHAVCLLGYVGEYFLMLNSWGDRWGQNGWAMWHERALYNMISSKFSQFFIVSEIERPEPRSWNYDKDLILG